MDIENSSLISENALQCGIYANNSTICFRQSDYPYTANISIFTEGNVVFKGIYDDFRGKLSELYYSVKILAFQKLNIYDLLNRLNI